MEEKGRAKAQWILRCWDRNGTKVTLPRCRDPAAWAWAERRPTADQDEADGPDAGAAEAMGVVAAEGGWVAADAGAP